MQAVRDAAQAAVRWAADGRVGILVSQPATDAVDWALTGFGITVGQGTAVELPVAVARWLLADRVARLVAAGDDLSDFDGLLVMGDGSFARDDKAPGHLDERAVPFDDAVVSALADGNAGFLAGLDLGLAAELGATGAPAWQAVAAQTDEVLTSELDLASAPYGVMYAVARWTVRWADRA